MPKFSLAGPVLGIDNYRFLTPVTPDSPRIGISERSGCRVKGLTLASDAAVYVCAAVYLLRYSPI